MLFPVSGLFVLRSPTTSTAELRDQSFVTFDTGAYRTDHSHLDALSVTLYSHGTTRVPEAGLFTYVPGPDFDYFHGTRGTTPCWWTAPTKPKATPHRAATARWGRRPGPRARAASTRASSTGARWCCCDAALCWFGTA